MDDFKDKVTRRVYNRLINSNIDSLKTLLLSNETELQQLTKLTSEEVDNIVQEACDVVLKSRLKPANEVNAWQRISTGCDSIDAVTRGGIPVNGIVEIMGASGVGKTQVCLQLALMVQFPEKFGGLNKGAVYISTEDVFPSKRLHQLASKLPLKYELLNSELKLEDNVFIEHIADYEQLRRCLYVRLPILLTRHKIGLVIIDSIAGVFRSENQDVDYSSRSQQIISIATKLNELNTQFSVAILCTNQVTENIMFGKTEPCLGLTWSNQVTCRFAVNRFMERIRHFEVVFAPDLKNTMCKFVIKDDGLFSIK